MRYTHFCIVFCIFFLFCFLFLGGRRASQASSNGDNVEPEESSNSLHVGFRGGTKEFSVAEFNIESMNPPGIAETHTNSAASHASGFSAIRKGWSRVGSGGTSHHDGEHSTRWGYSPMSWANMADPSAGELSPQGDGVALSRQIAQFKVEQFEISEQIAETGKQTYTWHTRKWDDIEKEFGSSKEKGYSMEEAAQQLEKYGKNEMTPEKQTPWWVELLYQFIAGFTPVLWVATIGCFIAWKPLNGGTANLWLAIILLIVIFFSAVASFFQEFSAANAAAEMAAMVPANVRVMRGGTWHVKPSTDLVPGDIVQLEGGTKVPADMRLIKANQLKADKSMLTGESDPIHLDTESSSKNHLETANLALSGCMILEGSGTGMVVTTGDNTVLEKD